MKCLRDVVHRSIIVFAFLCAACSTPKPVVQTNDVLPGDLSSVNRQFSNRESQQVITAMASVRTPKDIAATRPLESTPEGRWSDVYQAAVLGARNVEMAVVTSTTAPDEMRFVIVMLNNDPGELVVKGDAAHGVTSASAVAGLFEERSNDATRLVESFYSQLRLLGSIARPAPVTQQAAPSSQ